MNIRQKIGALREQFDIADNITLGLDIGIASCGWALIDDADKRILGAGTWGFEVPEVAKTRESKAAVRRDARGQRRRLRRRRYRMRDIRKLLFENDLLASPLPPPDEKGQSKPSLDPWGLRAEALDRKLLGEEFATILIHIAKHRGYRSNSKSEKASNAPAEDKKVLSGIEAMKEKSAKYRTIGEMLAVDPEFKNKKRNKDGDYSHTILRALHEDEVRVLFNRQRGFGLALSAELEEKYAKLAFDQLPLQGSEKMLGKCPFEPDEYRASLQAYSFEKFRYLTKLINSRIEDGSDNGRRLTKEEMAKAIAGFGKSSSKVTWKGLIRLLGLPKTTQFFGVGEKAMSDDIARKSKGCAFGSHTLYKVIGEAGWNSLVQTPEVLDDIIHILTFLEDIDEIKKRIEGLKLEPLIHGAIIEGAKEGAFAGFAKAGHISAKAARNIIPGLLEGKTYDKACAMAEYDHAKENIADLDSLTNPVAKRAIVETLKQVNALVREFDMRPGHIHIELGRDVGKGADERGRIEKGIKKRTAAKEKAKKEFCELVGKGDCSSGELQRYELWKEQKQECMFCFPRKTLSPFDLCDGNHACEIEHILPRWRSHDNSWHNKALACAGCNREKGGRTPHEWFGDNEARWDEFEFRVKAMFGEKLIKGFKIRNLLIKNYEEREKGFIERNKNDMRFASRVIQNELRHLYGRDEMEGRRRIRARSGAITGTLRHLWGLDRLKYLPDEKGKKARIEDERHHGVDAMIVAACSQDQLHKLTIAMQKQEEDYGTPLKRNHFAPPWPEFCEQVIATRERAPVARSENRRGRGAGHEATIRKFRMEDGRRIVYERKAIDKVTEADMERLKDKERNKDLHENILKWIADGKPQDRLPKRNNGHPIRKVTLRAEKNLETERAGFEVNKGLVDNGEMVRVDVFEKDKKFYLVPIYTHQVADRKQWPEPPNKIIKGGKPEKEWDEIDDSYNFKFSLYPFSWVETINSKGEVKEGYYRGADRATASITLSREVSRQQTIRGIGVKTLKSFKKFQVDRLGRKAEIKSEKRTWHGVVCT